jgi:methionine sulfoxide reductase heme-binding subunit
VSAIYYAVESPQPMFRLSMASAYAGLALLTAALLCGPWNVLRGRPNPVTTDLRRDIGIWAAFLGLTHVVVGLQVHMQGKFWLYFLYPPDQPYLLRLRHDAFGFANFLGLGATLVLMLLLGLSNDFSLRTLGAKRWKALQRWNYVAFALMAAHSIVYQIIEKRTLPFLGLFGCLVFVAIIMQLMGFRRTCLRADRIEGVPKVYGKS